MDGTPAWIVAGVNLGTILFAAGVFYALTKSDMKALRENIVEIKAALEKQTQILTNQAVQEERIITQGRLIASLTTRIDDLARGDGWIKPTGRRGVDGEYP